MRGSELLDKMSGISEKYITEAYDASDAGSFESDEELSEKNQITNDRYVNQADTSRAKKNVKRSTRINKKRAAIIGIIAAAVCAAVVSVALSIGVSRRDSVNISYTPPATSDKYKSLTELLDDLKDNEIAVQTMGQSSSELKIFGADNIINAAVVGDTACSFNKEATRINCYDLSSGSDEPTGYIDDSGMAMLSCCDRLVVMGSTRTGDLMSEDYESYAKSYSLHGGKASESSECFKVDCSMDAAFVYNDLVYMVCHKTKRAADYMGNNDQYMPQITSHGELISFTEDEISILGEPKTMTYTTVIAYDPAKDSIRFKGLYYGDVKSLFLDGDGIMLETQFSDPESIFTPSSLYCFNKSDLHYRGSLSCADIFGIEKQTSAASLDTNGVDIAYIKSANLHTNDGVNIIRVIGVKCYYKGLTEQKRREELFALSFNLETGSTEYTTLLPYENSSIIIDEATWEAERCIVTLSSWDNASYSKRMSFVFADFEKDIPNLIQSDVKVKDVNGVDMIYGGATLFGWHEAMVPLGNGRYLRYTDTSNCLDLYDLSDSSNARLVAEGLAPIGDDRFEFHNLLYPDGEHIGIAVIKKGGKGSEYRDASIVWRVYRIDGDSLTEEAETPISSLYRSVDMPELFISGTRVCYICPDTNKLIVTG